MIYFSWSQLEVWSLESSTTEINYAAKILYKHICTVSKYKNQMCCQNDFLKTFI